MKSIFYIVLTAIVLVAAALNTEDTKKEAIQGESADKQTSVQVMHKTSSTLSSGLKKVLASLDKLDSVVDKQKQRISIAEKLSEDWDQIEKQVEEKYPEDYENIEKSLYPLLAKAKMEHPNLVSVKQLVEDTTKKVHAFMKKVGKTSS